MHPPLHRAHPKCADIVQMLIDCHEEHKWGKFVGKCNELKAELDWCFRMEKEEKRVANMTKAREFDAKFEQYLANVAAKSEKRMDPTLHQRERKKSGGSTD